MTRRRSAALAAALVALLTLAAVPAYAQGTEPPAPGDVGPGKAEYPVGRRTIEVTSEPGRVLTAGVLKTAADAQGDDGAATDVSAVVGLDLEGGGHQSYRDVCYYQELAAAKPETAAPIVEAIDSYADDACTPKHLPIAQAHRLIDRYAIGFLERYVAGEKSAEKWLEPTQPKVVSVRVKR